MIVNIYLCNLQRSDSSLNRDNVFYLNKQFFSDMCDCLQNVFLQQEEKWLMMGDNAIVQLYICRFMPAWVYFKLQLVHHTNKEERGNHWRTSIIMSK